MWRCVALVRTDVSALANYSTIKMEAKRFFETSDLTRSTRHLIADSEFSIVIAVKLSDPIWTNVWNSLILKAGEQRKEFRDKTNISNKLIAFDYFRFEDSTEYYAVWLL
jgi:hypothetical protein